MTMAIDEAGRKDTLKGLNTIPRFRQTDDILYAPIFVRDENFVMIQHLVAGE